MVQTAINRSGSEKAARYQKMLDDYAARPDDDSISTTELGEARRVIGLLSCKDKTLTIPVTVIGFGDVAFVGFGGEPFTEYAAKARALAPKSFVIAACCANGQQGYLPVKSAFTEGGYEARSSRFTDALPDDVMGAVSKLLKKYGKK